MFTKMSEEEMKAQDDGSLLKLCQHVDTTYMKTVNTFPYRGIVITKQEFDKLKQTPGLKHVENSTMLEFYSM